MNPKPFSPLSRLTWITVFAGCALSSVSAAVSFDGTTFYSSGNASDLSVAADVMTWDIPSTNSEIRTYFTNPGEALSLDNMGETLTVSMQVRFSANLAGDTDTRNDTLRFGLLNSGSTAGNDLQQLKSDGAGTTADFSTFTGYSYQASTSDQNTAGQLGRRTGTSTSSSAVLSTSQWDLTSGADPWSLPNTPTWLDLTLEVERTGQVPQSSGSGSRIRPAPRRRSKH